MRLGVEAAVHEVLTPLEILGEIIATHWGPSRVLAIGGPELEQAALDGGHTLVPIEQWKEAQVVVVGNDFGFSYERLTAAARAAAAGAHFVTPNIDPRLPLEDGDFLPGCGAIVEAVAAAAGVRPLVVGKPEPPLFELALKRMGLTEQDAVMVGDSVDSDVRGARRVGMTAVLFAPEGGPRRRRPPRRALDGRARAAAGLRAPPCASSCTRGDRSGPPAGRRCRSSLAASRASPS